MAECDRSEGTVRRGVTVAASDGHAGLGESELGTDDVHDSLAPIVEAEERNAELATVRFDGDHHLLGEVIRERTRLVVSRHDVVDGRETCAEDIGRSSFARAEPRRPEGSSPRE